MAKWEEAPEVDLPTQSAQSQIPKWQSAPEIPSELPDDGLMNPTAETLATLTSGAVAQPLAGLAGIGASLIPGVSAADTIRKIQDTLTYAPRTATAKKALEYIASPFEWLAKNSSALGGKVGGDFGSMAGRVAGEALPMLLPLKMRLASRVSPELQSLRTGAQEARAAGYKVPPTMAGDPSKLADIAQGIGGKIKTQQEASIANQEVTNNLIKRDLGVPADTQLTPEVLSGLKQEAYKGYDDIKNLPDKFQATDEYIDKLHAIGSDVRELAKEFPDIASHKEIRAMIGNLAKPNMTPRNAVNLIKQLRYNAKANYLNRENPAKGQLADAQSKAAELLEDMIDSNLQDIGKPELLDNFRAARTQLAKIHDVDKVYNETTGTVPARKLGALLDKGAPLTGGMKTAAQFGRRFEKASQTPEMIGGVSMMSPLDMMASAGLGVAGGLTQGPYGSLAAMLPALRPLARKVILSDLYQQGAPKALKGPLSAVNETYPFLLQSAGERH